MSLIKRRFDKRGDQSPPYNSIFIIARARQLMKMELAQWTIRLQKLAAKTDQDDSAHDLQHLYRVWKTAQILMEANPQADVLVVQAACFLHDLVNLPKNHPERTKASCMAAQEARRQLERIHFPTGKLDAVVHAIEAHSFSAAIAPRTIEAKLVQDADRLDALGAIGLARLFYTAGLIGSALAHPTDPLATRRTLNDQAFALDHIAVKLDSLPGSMQTQAGRELGYTRLRLAHMFRDQFAAEWI